MRALSQSILTPRLRLEPVTPAMALAAREGQGAFAQAVGAEAPPDWCASSLGLISRAAGGWTPRMPTRAIVIHIGDGVVVGDVRFEPPRPSERELGDVEIGYSVAPTRRRQGYATEAAGAIIDWLFAEAAVATVLAGCDRDNRASVRTLRRLGFWLDSNPGRNFWWVRHAAPQIPSRA